MDAVTVTVPATVATYFALHLGVPWLRARLAKRDSGRPFSEITPSALPKSSAQSDAKFRAVAIEGFERIEDLHKALGKKSDTDGFVILEMFKSLVTSMNRQTEILGEQTALLRQIAGKEKPDTRYRGPAA